MKENYRSFTVELHDYTNEELVEFFQSTQKEEYLKELMVKNRGIIHIIATTYSIPAYDIEDLMEIGYIALWDATKYFDKSKGFTFTTLLKSFLKQEYNRLYTEAHRVKRGGNKASVISWEELNEINKERYSYDDYSILYIADFLKVLTGTTKKVAELLLDGGTNGEIAKALSCSCATVSYHIKRIRQAYTAYMGEV